MAKTQKAEPDKPAGTPAGVLKINEHDLINELKAQPTLYQEWADSLALAKCEAARLEQNLKLTEAELVVEIKNYPERVGLDKPSVDIIKAAVIKHSRYQTALSASIEADLEVGRIGAMVGALSSKKTSLELIVQLTLSGLYADVKVPKADRDAVSLEERRRSAKSVAY